MADPTAAFQNTMRHEDFNLSGIVTKDPSKSDPNAIARFGVNSAAHPEALRAGYYQMDRAAALIYAEALFKNSYFNAIGGYQITDQGIANKFADLAYQVGVTEATLIVQRACNNLPPVQMQVQLAVDGKCGMKTIDAINRSMPSRLLMQIRLQAEHFFRNWAMSANIETSELNSILKRVDA